MRDRCESSASSSSGGDFGGMFSQREPKDEYFVFEGFDVLDSEHDDVHLLRSAPVHVTGHPSYCTVNVSADSLNANSEGKPWMAIRFRYSTPDGDTCESVLWCDALRQSRRAMTVTEALAFDRVCFAMGMYVLCWYYMGFACPTIRVSRELSRKILLPERFKAFWLETLNGVLAEFLYVNRDRLSFDHVELDWDDADMEKVDSVLSSSSNTRSAGRQHSHPILVPIGGGKDSLVVWHMAVEQLQQRQQLQRNETQPLAPTLLCVSDGFYEYANNSKLQQLIQQTGHSVLVLRHELRDKVFDERSRSYLEPCGHPWAALVLFDALFAALFLLTDCEQVWLGYERSADEGNGVFIGQREVNHQYDKSSLFMRLSSRYIAEAIGDQVHVTSPLDTMWELDIARLFCQTPSLRPFHSLFLSCNEPILHEERGLDWCLRCEKCAFLVLLLSAWLEEDYLLQTIFRDNMLRNADSVGGEQSAVAQGYYNACRASREEVFCSLCDETGQKPFDCVGTAKEARAAVALSLWRYLRANGGNAQAVPDLLWKLIRLSGFPDETQVEYWLAFQSENEVLSVHGLEKP